jgi:simple sugar transport system ATP-binding protein/ribose transport system ATP-binding protein
MAMSDGGLSAAGRPLKDAPDAESHPRPPLVEALGISKRFGGAQALEDVTVTMQRGSVHALVGENGAGKSTLGRILSGIIKPDHGQLRLSGNQVHFAAPRDAQRAGVAAVSQELTLVPQLSVIENVFLGVEKHRLGLVVRRDLRDRFADLVDQLGFVLSPDVRVGKLGVADRQKVEVLRALARGANIIVMDEPTSALPAGEVKQLLGTVRRLTATGTTVLYVSHALDEVLEIADEVTVLRDGRVVRTTPAAGETKQTLATAMLGRPLDLSFPEKQALKGDAKVIFEARGLARPPEFESIDIAIRSGEIVGIAGLIDSGATEIARVIAGDLRPSAGELIFETKPVHYSSPLRALHLGISLLPESRREEGLFMRRPIRENVTATVAGRFARFGIVRRGREGSAVLEHLKTFEVRMPSVDAPVNALSGGNQQKVLLGKCVFVHPKLLVALQPTRGVDIGAKAAMYRLLVDLAASGMGIVLVSPEIEEIYGLAHRILVLRRGRMIDEVVPEETTYARLMDEVLGATDQPAAAT